MSAKQPTGEGVREDGAQFEPFDLTVSLGPDLTPWLSATSRVGAVHGIPRRSALLCALPDLLDMVYDYADDIQFAELQPRPKLSRMLGKLVFGEPAVAQLFQATRGVAADRGRQVLFRILASPHLAALPWELLPDPAAHGNQQPYLALAPDTHMVRQARGRTYATRMSMLEAPLNLLLVLSSPIEDDREDWLSFDIFEVKRNLLAELAPLEQAGLLRIDVEDRPTLDNLRRRIGAQRRGYHLFHYVGHAFPDGLILEDASGYREDLSGARLAELLRLCPDLRLAVFSGCETARAADPSTVSANKAVGWRDLLSLADYCVQEACPAVIGMQAVLPFSTERVFTRFFYQALASGYTTAESLRLARGAIQADRRVGGDLLDWSVPSLFVGSGEPGALVPRTAAPPEVRPRARAELNIGLRQSNTRFFGRDLPLRQAVDVMTGRTAERVLVVAGAPGVGKTALVDRALEEVGNAISHSLFVSSGHLTPEVGQSWELLAAGKLPDLKGLSELKADEPLKKLCRLADEVLRYSGVETRERADEWDAREWWTRLVEDMVRRQFVLIIDDAGALSGLQHELLKKLLTQVLNEYVKRRRRKGEQPHRLQEELREQLSKVEGILAKPGAKGLSAALGELSLPEVVSQGMERLPARLLRESAQIYCQCLEQRIFSLNQNTGSSRAALIRTGPALDAEDFEHLFPALLKLEAERACLGSALSLLADRRSQVRVVIAAASPPQDFFNLPDNMIFTMRLAPLTWTETWRWIRRNLPGLVRFGEDYTARLWGRFGTQLELWEELERLTLRRRNQNVNLIELAEQKIVPSILPQPKDGVGQAARRSHRSLRIAVAGPRLAGPGEIAEALTRLAREHGVGGRVAFDAGEAGTLATLIDEPSPFAASGQASSVDLYKWLDRVIARQPDIILLDYGAQRPIGELKNVMTFQRMLFQHIHHRILLIAAGGNKTPARDAAVGEKRSRQTLVMIPSAYPEVLSVGPLGGDGKLRDYAVWHPRIAKPDLFMTDNLAVTPLAVALRPEAVQARTLQTIEWGAGFAAIHAVATAVLVWSFLPEWSPQEIRQLLVEAGQPVPGKKGARGLMMESAIALARRRLVEQTLTEGPASLQTLSAITGLERQTLSLILKSMIEEGRVLRLATGRLERFQLFRKG